MASVKSPFRHGLLLHGVDWHSYLRWLRLMSSHPGYRLTYDRGTLEIMPISSKHERLKHFLRRLLEALSEELAVVIAGFGSMTCKRKRKRRGVEPDECYYVQHAAQVAGKDDIDLRTDPPPDLGIEIDVTHSSLDRLSIYAALRVLEVWRYDGTTLTFYLLGAAGKYAEVGVSSAFPRLTPSDLAQFLALRTRLDENAAVAQFRAWVRQNLAAGGSRQTTP